MKIPALMTALLLVVSICYTANVSGIEPVLKPGDILLTRNAGGEAANTSPGYYNHIAIVGENNWVIESQQILDAVIAVPIWHFFDRYPEILVLRPRDPNVAKMSAIYATKMIGRHYNKYESVRPLFLWHSGDNCVSTVKRIYNGIGINRRWIVPDHLMQDAYILTPIALKKDYENFVEPLDKYRGYIIMIPRGEPDA